MQEVIEAIREMETDRAYGSLTVHFRKGQVSGMHKEIVIQVKPNREVKPNRCESHKNKTPAITNRK